MAATEETTCTVDNSEKKTDICSLCNKVFVNKFAFIQHCKVHTGDSPHECHVCHKQFAQNSHLKTHLRTHTGERPFSCNVCDKTFRHAINLKNHEWIHTGKRPFVCDICNKAFAFNGDLKKHHTVHTGERNHVCNVCDKRFRQKSSLNEHMLRHAIEKPFACEFCQKSFSTKKGLRRHSLTHKIVGNEEKNCGSKGNIKFPNKVDMEDDLAIHSNAKVPKSNCNFNNDKESLSFLSECHSMEVLECEKCQKIFINESNLDEHICELNDVILNQA